MLQIIAINLQDLAFGQDQVFSYRQVDRAFLADLAFQADRAFLADLAFLGDRAFLAFQVDRPSHVVDRAFLGDRAFQVDRAFLGDQAFQVDQASRVVEQTLEACRLPC